MSKRKSDDGPPLEEMDEEEKQSGSGSSNGGSDSGSGRGSQHAHKKQCADAAADKPAEISAEEEGAAIERRKKISLATVRLLSQLTAPGIEDCRRLTRFSIAWNDIDVNFVGKDGASVIGALLSALRRLHVNVTSNHSSFFVGWVPSGRKSQIDACHDAIIAALLKYEKHADQPELTIRLPNTSLCAILPHTESVQPRDADHLMFLFACELIPSCYNTEMLSLVEQLVHTLMQRGFDLDTRDAHGSSLLSIAALTALLTPDADPAFSMLVNLGADPCRWRNAQGHNLLHHCADFTAAQLHRLDPWEFDPTELLQKLQSGVRLLASYGVDTVDDSVTGEAYWQRLMRTIRDSPPHDEHPDPDNNIPSLVAETVLLELFAAHAEHPWAYPVRSRHTSLLLHYALTSHPPRPRLPVASKLGSMLEGKGPWSRHPLALDIHVRDDQDRTLQQIIQQVIAEENDAVLHFILAQLDELQRQWMEHERPFVQRQLSEQTDLPPELCDLAMSFVDGLDHKGERDVDDVGAPEKEDGMADAQLQGAADGEQLVAGL